jgi:hypothetical protein
MGYSTDFTGALQLSRQLTDKEKNYINLFSSTRRMKRDVNKLMELYKGEHGYPFATENTPEAIYGREGEFFARRDGEHGQKKDDSIIDYNTPPNQMEYSKIKHFEKRMNENQKKIKEGLATPGLWCQWIINDDNELEWDGGEKFYYYTEWLRYLIVNFFEKWGVKLNGVIKWEGEDSDNDRGKIVVVNNDIKVLHGKVNISYEEE